jgi:hypothetical protein
MTGIMSIEYEVHAEKLSKEVFSLIVGSIKDKFPTAQRGSDESLWIPSSNPKWVDFSIEKTSVGLFIVSNMNGTDREKVFSLIESILTGSRISYSIEEI